jgi:hypothetical protein
MALLKIEATLEVPDEQALIAKQIIEAVMPGVLDVVKEKAAEHLDRAVEMVLHGDGDAPEPRGLFADTEANR